MCMGDAGQRPPTFPASFLCLCECVSERVLVCVCVRACVRVRVPAFSVRSLLSCTLTSVVRVFVAMSVSRSSVLERNVRFRERQGRNQGGVSLARRRQG